MKSPNRPHVLEAAKIAPSRPTAPSAVEQQMLVTLYAQERLKEAEQVAHSLTQQYPNHPFGWKLLGAILWQADRTAEALAPMQKAVALMPTDWEAINNLGSTLDALGHLDHSEACFRRAIELKPDAPHVFNNLAELLLKQGHVDEAMDLFRKKLSLQPDDAYTQQVIAMYTGGQTERAPDQFVAQTFDFYADSFDAHLQGKLGYKAPEQLVAMVAKHLPQPAEKLRVLDLGCGTGLVGLAVAPMARELVGVDLSPKMLEKAREKAVYQRLECADLLTMMRAEPESAYDLLIAADVFIYLGKLDEVMVQCKRLLTPGGQLAFTTEVLGEPGQDYRLNSTGRYTHASGYLERLAKDHGFTPIESLTTSIRTEASQPVPSHLLVWRT